MSIRSLIKRLSQVPVKYALCRKMAVLSVPKTSEVNLLRVRGRIAQSHLLIGRGTTCNAIVTFDRSGATVEVGDRCFIGKSSIIAANRVTIGNDVLVSWNVTIVDHSSHSTNWELRSNDVTDWRSGKKDWTHVDVDAVTIGNKVWIGFGAIILKGVSIGDGAVVAAGSVVTRPVPAWTIVAGTPAKVIREMTPCV